jgi:hypothetical protein
MYGHRENRSQLCDRFSDDWRRNSGKSTPKDLLVSVSRGRRQTIQRGSMVQRLGQFWHAFLDASYAALKQRIALARQASS